jgi:hypothetical protein
LFGRRVDAMRAGIMTIGDWGRDCAAGVFCGWAIGVLLKMIWPEYSGMRRCCILKS